MYTNTHTRTKYNTLLNIHNELHSPWVCAYIKWGCMWHMFQTFTACLLGRAVVKTACQCPRCKRCKFNPWAGKIPWSRKWQPIPVFSPGKYHGQWSLVGYIQSMGHRVRHNWAGIYAFFTYQYTISKYFFLQHYLWLLQKTLDWLLISFNYFPVAGHLYFVKFIHV